MRVSIGVWLLLAVGSCGLSSSGPRPAGTASHKPGDGSTPPFPDYCEPNGKVGNWAVDCERYIPDLRCIPSTQLRWLCHQAGPPHVYGAPLTEGALGYAAEKTPLGICDATVEAWRVFRVKIDRTADGINPNTMAQIDGQAGKSWPGMTRSDCLSSPADASLTYAQDHPTDYMLTTGDDPGSVEIVPLN